LYTSNGSINRELTMWVRTRCKQNRLFAAIRKGWLFYKCVYEM